MPLRAKVLYSQTEYRQVDLEFESLADLEQAWQDRSGPDMFVNADEAEIVNVEIVNEL